MEIMVVKTLSGGLKPAYDSDLEKFKKIPLNEKIRITYKKTRNIGFHRKFFALMNLVFQNQERYKFLDCLREDLIIEAGFFFEEVNLRGEVIKKAKSISFASMDENEFSELYNSVIDVIVEFFKFERQDIIDNIDQYF